MIPEEDESELPQDGHPDTFGYDLASEIADRVYELMRKDLRLDLARSGTIGEGS